MRPVQLAAFALAFGLGLSSVSSAASKPKVHTVGLGGVKRVPYSVKDDPAGALPEEKGLRVRPLIVDGKVKEWTTGESHDVTDRSFAVRRALRLNDALPTDKAGRWAWQRGPWLLVDRTAGHVTAIHLPDYDPAVSSVVWFRDYAAYCGVTSGGKQLYAVVAQISARKPILRKKLGTWDPGDHAAPACGASTWQREPLRVTFQAAGADPASFDVVGLSAVLVEGGADEE